MKVIEREVCIAFKNHAIRQVINLVMQLFEGLDRKAGKINKYVKCSQSGLELTKDVRSARHRALNGKMTH
jgi:hypothetical protein